MSRIALLIFHGIGRPGRVLDPGEAPYWVSEALFSQTLDLALAAPRPVGITFDDGNASDIEIAAPLLEVRGLKGAFYALTGRIGQAGSLSAADLRSLAAAGHEVGSHGIDHLDWRRLAPEALAAETAGSRARLEDILGQEVRSAAIPFGAYAPRVLAALRRAGYDRVHTSDGGLARPGAWLRPRSSVRDGMTPEIVAGLLAGRMPPLRHLRRAAAMAVKRGIVLAG